MPSPAVCCGEALAACRVSALTNIVVLFHVGSRRRRNEALVPTQRNMTLSARVVAVACLFVAVSAFAPAPRVTGCRAVKTSSPLSMSPVELASVTEASTVLSQLPTQLVSLEVTTAAFLAVRRVFLFNRRRSPAGRRRFFLALSSLAFSSSLCTFSGRASRRATPTRRKMPSRQDTLIGCC